MANAVYDLGRAAFLGTASGQINWTNDNIKAVLVNTAGYAVNAATDQYLSIIGATYRVATSANLSSKTVTAGVADAADPVFSSVTGATCSAVVIYKDTGTDTTSPLICYIDNATGSPGLPVTPNGGNITVTFDNGTNRIFKL